MHMLTQLIVAFFAVYGFYSFMLCVRELLDKWMRFRENAPEQSKENDQDDSPDDGKSL